MATSQKFPVITRRRRLAICGLPFAVTIQMFLGLCWLLVICQGTLLPVPILFEFGSGTALGWKEWVDKELFDTGFIGLLQPADVLKAIALSYCLSNYRDLFNLHHFFR